MDWKLWKFSFKGSWEASKKGDACNHSLAGKLPRACSYASLWMQACETWVFHCSGYILYPPSIHFPVLTSQSCGIGGLEVENYPSISWRRRGKPWINHQFILKPAVQFSRAHSANIVFRTQKYIHNSFIKCFFLLCLSVHCFQRQHCNCTIALPHQHLNSLFLPKLHFLYPVTKFFFSWPLPLSFSLSIPCSSSKAFQILFQNKILSWTYHEPIVILE